MRIKPSCVGKDSPLLWRGAGGQEGQGWGEETLEVAEILGRKLHRQ